MAGDGMVMSSDKKVVKIWDRNNVCRQIFTSCYCSDFLQPASNFASITPVTDLNDVHHVPGSGLIMSANEGIQMCTYYIPQLGPAPRWASFLENITEEMEDQTTRSVYEDYKFVERNELKNVCDHDSQYPLLVQHILIVWDWITSLGHLPSSRTCTATSFPSSYTTPARIIANPFAYDEHREKLVREKLEKEAESRIPRQEAARRQSQQGARGEDPQGG